VERLRHLIRDRDGTVVDVVLDVLAVLVEGGSPFSATTTKYDIRVCGTCPTI
jgi:hypothetical protein